jgi:hypothetical protein
MPITRLCAAGRLFVYFDNRTERQHRIKMAPLFPFGLSRSLDRSRNPLALISYNTLALTSLQKSHSVPPSLVIHSGPAAQSLLHKHGALTSFPRWNKGSGNDRCPIK